MGLLVADCPRCGATHITFDVVAQVWLRQEYDWRDWYEIFSVCRRCHLPTTFIVAALQNLKEKLNRGDGLVTHPSGLNEFFGINRFVSLRDHVSTRPPEHLPDPIKNAFNEGAACLSIDCFNAAASMYRLCVDLVTRPLLAACADSAKPKPHDTLGRRLTWMFENKVLPVELRELATCIREDGNDGVHQGTLTKADADDLLDHCCAARTPNHRTEKTRACQRAPCRSPRSGINKRIGDIREVTT